MKATAAQTAKRMTHPEVTVPTYRAQRGRQHPLVRPLVERIPKRRRPAVATATQRRLPRLGIRLAGRARDRHSQAGIRRQGFARRHSPGTSGPLALARDLRPATSDARTKCRTPGDTRGGCITPVPLVTDVPAFRTTGIRAASDSRGIRCPPHPIRVTPAPASDSRDTRPPVRNAGHLVTRVTDASHLPHW